MMKTLALLLAVASAWIGLAAPPVWADQTGQTSQAVTPTKEPSTNQTGQASQAVPPPKTAPTDSGPQSILDALRAGAIIIDVRTPREVKEDAIEGVPNVPHRDIKDRIAHLQPDKTKPVILFCRSGHRAGIAKKTLEQLGYKHVFNAGGIQDMRVFLTKVREGEE